MSIHSDARTAEAVGSLAGQDIPVEIVVVNTGSGTLRGLLADRLHEIVLVETATALLPGGTRNIGLDEARGPLIAFLAADCLAAPGWVAQRLDAHARHRVVASALLPAPARDGNVRLPSRASSIYFHDRRAPYQPAELALRYGVSYRREVFDLHGRFLEDRMVGEDTEFNARLAPERPEWLPDLVTYHRYPATSAGVMVDAFIRGQQRHVWMRAQRNLPTLRCLMIAADNLRYATRQTVGAPPERRRQMLPALPLIWCIGIAYGLGIALQVGRRGDATPMRNRSSRKISSG